MRLDTEIQHAGRLARDGVSREVPCSALKGETVPDSLPAEKEVSNGSRAGLQYTHKHSKNPWAGNSTGSMRGQSNVKSDRKSVV